MMDENEQLKITSTGLKLFERQDAKVHVSEVPPGI